MKETILFAVEMWNQYWGDSKYPWMLLGVLVILLIHAFFYRDTRFVLVSVISLLFVQFCPVTAWVISKLIGRSIYWRMFWAVPFVPVAAYAACIVIQKLPGKILKFLATAAMCAAIGFCGVFQVTSGNFMVTHNAQQVPDEIEMICHIIAADNAGKDTVLVAGNDYISSYLRVYDPNFLMPYGRRGADAVDENAEKLYWHLETMMYPETITERAKDAGCNYLIVDVSSSGVEDRMNRHGYATIAHVGRFAVLKADA